MELAEKSIVQDLVCGMLVERQSAAGSVFHEGENYYFCCPNRESEFEHSPALYLERQKDLPVADNSGCGCSCAPPSQPGVVQLDFSQSAQPLEQGS